MDIVKHNKSAWNNYVDKKDCWTIPVSEQELENTKKGNWNIVLIPKKPVPHNWFPVKWFKSFRSSFWWWTARTYSRNFRGKRYHF